MDLIEYIDELFVERIQHPPRLFMFKDGFDKYIKTQVRAFKGYIPKLKAMIDASERLYKHDRYALRELDQSLGIDSDYLEGRARRLIDEIENALRFFGDLSARGVQFTLRVFSDAIEMTKEIAKDTSELFDSPDTFQWAVEESMRNNDDPDNPAKEWKDFVRYFIPGVVAFHECIARMKSESAKLGEALKSTHLDYKPSHEDVETLYHASTDATNLKRNGFDLGVVKKSQAGLGWYGNPSHLSFTSDLYVAKEIARTFKEVIQIAKGKVRASDIYDWAKRDGGKTFEGVKSWVDLEKPKSKFDHDIGDLKHPTPEELDKWFRNPHTVMQMYNNYMHRQKKRYNAVFAGLSDPEFTRRMAKRKESDVGVLECTVDMTKSVSYHKAEREFRIPPEAVLSIDKVIR